MEEARFSAVPATTIPFAHSEISTAEFDATTTEASAPYVGRWNRLISTTNWEKGAIIAQWRELLLEQNLPTAEHSDEAWARMVGGVSGQHVGRLRRVYQRFGAVHTQYEKLYWSHFQAALDWNDAEMWLEGAVQNQWSVNELRRNRWETLGSVPADQPLESEIVAAETDEDYQPSKEAVDHISPRFDEAHAGPTHEGPDFGDEGERGSTSTAEMSGVNQLVAADAIRPFENLPSLPEDVGEAFETFKLAILHHRSENWQQISRDDLIASLEALKVLAMAPTE